MPSDIDPRSGFRLSLPNREDLDEAGKKAYDRGTTPGATIMGLQGPAGIQLFSPKTAPHHVAINRYLRFEAGFTPRIREIAILTTAREMDSQFEWVAHEPEALKEGVPPDRHRRHQAPPQHRRTRRDRRDRHRAGPADLARPQGEIGNFRQAEDAVRTAKGRRAGHADGQLCRHGCTAGGCRHAAASRSKAASAGPLNGTGRRRAFQKPDCHIQPQVRLGFSRQRRYGTPTRYEPRHCQLVRRARGRALCHAQPPSQRADGAPAADHRIRRWLSPGQRPVFVRSQRRPLSRSPERLRRVRYWPQPPGRARRAEERARQRPAESRPARCLDPRRHSCGASAQARALSRQGVLRQFGRRGGRGRDQVRAHGDRPPGHRLLRPRLPWADLWRAVAQRRCDLPRRLRADAAELHAHSVQRSAGAGTRAGGSRCRGVHRRANSGQGREHAGRRLSAIGGRDLPPPRHAVRRRRNPDRSRAHRPVLRGRALGRRAGHGAGRQVAVRRPRPVRRGADA